REEERGRKRLRRRGTLGCALLALLLGSSSVDLSTSPGSFYPRFNPFFFLCTHHGELEGAGVAEGGGEVLLSLQITGSPTAYTPGQEYQGEPDTYALWCDACQQVCIICLYTVYTFSLLLFLFPPSAVS
uniref:Reelin domain-containing protein n=1 Tax=Periophthalmus magnuspinnatus TaxID=409849 RepID=A0A3B3ZRT5_9GOBI